MFPANTRVLVVDDFKIMRRLVTKLLSFIRSMRFKRYYRSRAG